MTEGLTIPREEHRANDDGPSEHVQSLTPHRATIKRHLNLLAPKNEGETLEIACGQPDEGPKEAKRFTRDQLDEAAEFAVAQNISGCNVYIGAAPRKGSGSQGRANASEFAGSQFLWIDADGEVAAVEHVLKTREITPAFVVQTGNIPELRKHYYFRLSGRRQGDANEVRKGNKALQRLLRTDAAVVNPIQLLRLAGTINYPNASKVERGYIAELTTLTVTKSAKPVDIDRLHEIAQAKDKPTPNSVTKAGDVQQSVPPISATILALTYISAKNYDDWLRVGMALKNGYGDGGLSPWIEWSKTAPDKFKGDDDCRSKSRSFKGATDKPVTVGTIIHMAREGGCTDYKEVIERARDRELSEAIGALSAATLGEGTSGTLSPTSPTAAAAHSSMPGFPPGLVGDIAFFVAKRLPFLTPNIALATALAAVSRMNANCAVVVAPSGRKTPVNLYILLTAHSGAGKEVAREALNEIGKAVANENLIAAAPASPQALGRTLSKRARTSLLLFNDEYGKKLAHANSGSGAHDNAVNALLLELFGLALGTFAGRTYSKEKDNIGDAELPYVGVLAATTIEPLAAALSDASVYDGTLNRFLYLPQSETLIRNSDVSFGEVPQDIVYKCRALWSGSEADAAFASAMALREAKNTLKTAGGLFRAITMTTEAAELFHEFDLSLDAVKERGGPAAALAARGAEQAIRVAGVVALGCAEELEQISLTEQHAQFGIDLVRHSMAKMLEFVDEELVSSAPKDLVPRILQFCRNCVNSPDEAVVPKDRARWREYNREGFVPRSQIVRKFRRVDKQARDNAIRTLIEAGDLRVESRSIGGNKIDLLQPRED